MTRLSKVEDIMICMEWNDDLRTGVDELDRHHVHLVDLLNQAYRASMYHHQREEFTALITELAEYAQDHFAAEVRHMENIGYAGLEDHLGEHALFVRKVDELQKELKGEKTEFSLDLVELTQFLADWLTHHIKEVDRKYAV